jgi:hypothetical protein
MDANVSRLSGREQLWIGEDGLPGSVCRPNRRIMGDRPHTREQVNSSALPRNNSSTIDERMSG